MPNEPAPLPSSRRDVDAFLAQRRQERRVGHVGAGRLIIAFDATASRGFTWQLACELQAEMLAEAGRVGGLKLQVVCFRGNREWEQSEWTSDAEALAAWMRRIECRTGYTQIARTLMRARDEHLKAAVSALVYVGDACEEEPVVLYGLARDLKMKAFVFQEAEDPEAAKIFQEIARLTGGAYCRFDAGAADQLRDLLRAVAVYAAGGQKALSASRNAGAVKLLQQLE
jgi:hypothetical protein